MKNVRFSVGIQPPLKATLNTIENHMGAIEAAS